MNSENKSPGSFLLLFCLLLFFSEVSAQKDSLKTKKVKVLPVPTVGYSPETSTYVGFVSLFTLDFYQDTETRTSNAKLEFTYTWNKQIVLETAWNYFFKKEKWFTQGQLIFADYPDRYFGIGSDTPDSAEVWFDSKRIVADVALLKSVRPKMFLGPNLNFASYSKVSYQSDIEYSELTDRKNAAVGMIYLWDTRNNLLNATEGRYLEIYGGYSFNGEENNPLLKTDFRTYKTWSDKYTLAARWYTGLNFGTPTFYNYAIMGGDPLVRGYLYGRFRNNNLSTIQLESRNHLFWRIGFSVFGGYSYLFQNLDDTQAVDFKYNYGVGIRFLTDKKENINLRIDYARGEQGQDGFYISFGESF